MARKQPDLRVPWDVGEKDIYARAPRFELRDLRFFLAVAEHLNFTRAAERLGIAQPALSQHIQALERALKVNLFVRNRREVVITAEGKALLIYARRLHNTARVAAEVVQAISRGETGQLTIGAIFSSLFTVLPRLLKPFTERYPGVRVDLQELTIGEQISDLRERQIDLSILRGPIHESDLESTVLFREPFVVAVGRNHEFAKRKSVDLNEVVRHRLIGLTPINNGDFSAWVRSAFGNKGWKLDFFRDADDTQTLLGLVAAEIGISLVPASLCNIQPHQISYVPIVDETPATTIELVRHRDHAPCVVQNFLQSVKKLKW